MDKHTRCLWWSTEVRPISSPLLNLLPFLLTNHSFYACPYTESERRFVPTLLQSSPLSDVLLFLLRFQDMLSNRTVILLVLTIVKADCRCWSKSREHLFTYAFFDFHFGAYIISIYFWGVHYSWAACDFFPLE
jgi:hypothetical protein